MKTKISAGLAIIYDNKVLLAHTTNRGWYGSYGIPKGGIEKGESKIQAAIRETKEEVGISVPKNLIDNFRKKTHFGYQNAIHKRKDLDGRKAKTKDFLSKFNKKK